MTNIHSSSVSHEVAAPTPEYKPAVLGDHRALTAVLMQLQGSAGNRAVAGLFGGSEASPGAGSHALQRYKVVKPNPDPRQEERRSDTGRVWKVDAHRLFAPTEAVDTANEKLRSVGGASGQGGAAGAFVKLVATDEQHEGLPRVAPVVVKRHTGLTMGQSPRSTFLRQDSSRPVDDKGMPTYISPADCHVAAQSVMGSDDVAIGAYDTERPNMKGEDGKLEHFASAVEGGAHLATRAKHAFFDQAMPRFASYLENHEFISDLYPEVISAIRAETGRKTEFGTGNALAAVYRNLIVPNKTLHRLFSSRFGINEWAIPEVGRGLSNVNDETQKLAAETGPEVSRRDVWNFHWAGIVMVEGSDYVTLENLSTEDLNELNQNWYFQMYGKGAQSFHGEALRDPHATTASVTLGFDALSQAPHPKVNIKPTLNQKAVLQWVRSTRPEDWTLEKLARVPVKFGTPLEAFVSCAKKLSIVSSDTEAKANFPKVCEQTRDILEAQNIDTR